ncbi:MAG: glycosyltransferase family 4 protein, partial [Clostridia bacterium]|nr:glycosyltransferase family 4 protein [Clostridia bacterium]
MQRICHLSSVHSLTDTRIFFKECQTLAQAGYEVFLIGQHEKDELRDGIQILGLPKAKNRIERMLKTTRRLYQRAVACDGDLYHFHDPELIPVGLLLKRKGKKVVYDVHEDVPRQILSKDWIAAPLRKPLSRLVEKIENYAAKRFDYIVAATPHIRDRFLKVNPRAMDINNFPILSELHLPDADWAAKEKAACYIGGITKVRGIREMIRAVGMTGYKLFLAGRFSSTEEREKARQAEGWEQVVELGQLGRQEVREILSRSMVGLVVLHPIPNYLDALPVKMFEYMSAGIPVIASNFPLWKEIVEENQCGLCVNPLDAAEIAAALELILSDPKRARQMGENGRKAVEEKYNWETEGRKLLKLYGVLFEAGLDRG